MSAPVPVLKTFPEASPPDFVKRALALAPILAERSDQANLDRKISEDSVRLMREAGFLRMLRPKRFGGYEADFDVFVEVLDVLSQGCACSAWVCSVLTEHAWFIACFPEEAQIEVWGENPDACASASFAPRPVQPVPGGYKVSGTWSFSSGVDHAQWVLLGALGEQGPMFVLVPLREAHILDDWRTLGLRGTGSKSVQLTDIFVPTHRTLSYAGLMAGRTPGAEVHPDYYLPRAPQGLFGPYSLPSVVLGQAQKALDLFVNAQTGKRLPGGIAVSEQQMLQASVAECAAEIEMVRALIQTKVGRHVADLRARRPIRPEARLEGVRDFHVVVHRLLGVVLKLCALNGSRWVYEGDPMQTILRDVLTASAHKGAQWDNLIESGRAMFAASEAA